MTPVRGTNLKPGILGGSVLFKLYGSCFYAGQNPRSASPIRPASYPNGCGGETKIRNMKNGHLPSATFLCLCLCLFRLLTPDF
jgi:hypothetical protein